MTLRSARRLTAATIALALVATGTFACGSGSDTDPADENDSRSDAGAPTTQDSDDLLARLRGGGLVIVFRHAATDSSDEDDPQVDLNDCATQRNLNAQGRADARTIGRAFRQLRIPVGTRWASPYCRSRDTAELAFGGGEVINGLERLYPERDEAADRRLNELIGEHAPAPRDANLIIASHAVYPSVLEPAATLDEGEAAIYSVRGDDVDLLGQVAPDEWANLDRGAGSTDDAGMPSSVAERAQSSVVSVELRDGEPAGAGFRVAVDGIVVTNAHVVGDASEVAVVLADGTRRAARVLGRAPDVDIAALELEDDSGLPPMHSGTGLAEARAGDPVTAVGPSPGRPGAMVAGTIRALAQPVRLGDNNVLEALATDVAIEPVNSGAPLINADGHVLAVTTALSERGSNSTGFAIPVDLARSAALAIVQGRG